MKHLEDEDIARFVDGRVNRDEREEFLNHFSQCETCFEAYTDALHFMEEQKRSKTYRDFPIFKALRAVSFKEIAGVFSRRRVYVPALALLVLVLVLVPLVKQMITGDKITRAKLHYIEESIKNAGEPAAYSFSPSKDKEMIQITAALRAGFFCEDLHTALNSDAKQDLVVEIIHRLSGELRKILGGASDTLIPLLPGIRKENFPALVEQIQRRLGTRALSGLFSFGRFVEGAILSTFENKCPAKKDVEKYRAIAQKSGLPAGVLKDLNRLANAADVMECREICRDIKEVFL